MLAELKFVQGAVAKKDFVPAMTHFKIKDGLIQSYNGMIALCSPIDFGINCNPKAATLVQAIGKCEDEIQLSVTQANRLKVASGKFKAFIECINEEFPPVEPEGEIVELDGSLLLSCFTKIYDFIGNDASRPWSNGVLLKGKSAIATNNVCLVEYWLGVEFPLVANVPKQFLTEVLRIKQAPTKLQICEKSMTFHYEDGRWMRCQLLSTQWPDLDKVLNVENTPSEIDESIFEGIDAIKPFLDKTGAVCLKDGFIRTYNVETEGAEFEIEDKSIDAIFSAEMLNLLQGVATHVDFTRYPAPCIFYGNALRGAIVGIKSRENATG